MKKFYTFLIVSLIGFIGNAQNATIIYSRSNYCSSSPSEIPILIGQGNYLVGTFTSSPAGLQLNPVAGEVVPAASAPGNYFVKIVTDKGSAASKFIEE